MDGKVLLVLSVGFLALGGALLSIAPSHVREVGASQGGARLGLRSSSVSRHVKAMFETTRSSRAECLREMPELLDIVTLGLAAGLSFDAALTLYCTRYDTELSHRFSQAIHSWQMGVTTRAEALDKLADETDVAAVRRFASAVTEALSFGSPLASVLEQQSQAIRDEQRAQVEEEIEKVPVKMLIPMGTLIVPAMLLAILGPLLASAMRFG